MSFTDNTTFYGKDALGFYSKALLTGETKKAIKLYPNVKSKLKIASLDMSGLLSDADCTFTDKQTTVLAQKTLEVCDVKINVEFCTTTFNQNYLSEQLRAGSNGTGVDTVIPITFEEYVLEQIALNVSTDLENILWNGVTSGTGGTPTDICDGFRFKFSGDATVVDVTATTLTASNIITELGKVYDAIPAQIIDDPNLTIFMSTKASKFYKQAQAAVATGSGSYFIGDKALDFLGIKIIVSKQLPANVMVAASTENLWMGTDLMSDFDDVLVIPQKDKSGAPTVRFVANFKFGVNYGNGSEIVYYW